MRKLALLLALTTVFFAATTVHYRALWSEERARIDAVEATRARLAADRDVSSPPRFVAPNAVSANPPGPASPTSGPAQAHTDTRLEQQQDPSAESRRHEMEFSRAYLEQLAAPQAREDLVGQMKVNMRQMYPRVDKVLGLTPEEHDRLLELHAQEQIRLQEARARCVVDPACDPNQITYDSQGIDRDIAALLGPQRKARWENYRASLNERETVTHVRQRLPESSRLDDENAERLILALAEERQRIETEALQMGGGVGYGFGAGMLYTTANGSLESQIETAQRFSQRLRDRAAQFLDANQMRTFNELQDEQLMQLRAALRQKAMLDSVTHINTR